MFVRGANPIWSFVDLTGHQFDDTFYMYVLQNTLPYLPATVYHQEDGIPWNQPIQFFANGTLPNDIYFDPGSTEQPNVYRLEFRQNTGSAPPSQADPLIYLVENYVPGTGGGGIPTGVGFSTDNEITNAQFALVNFASPLNLTSTTSISVEIAPGWFLDLNTSGPSGTAVVNQVPLNSNFPSPTNAPYALRLTLSAWDSVVLRQRFSQNGIQWSNKFVSCAMTALVNGAPQSMSAVLVDSQGNPRGTVLSNVLVTGTFTELTGHTTPALPPSTDTDLPPNAYIEFQLLIPSNIDIYLTSFQIVASNLPIEFSYNQDTIERQIDHTFHYYQPQLNFKPIPSLLTGWDFPLNPNQFGITSFSNTPQYVWDQTIMCSVVGAINVAPVSTTGALSMMTNNPNESWYMLQYLQGGAALKTTLSNLSVNIDAYSIINPNVRVNVYLYYSNTNGTIPNIPLTIGSITNALTGQFTLSQSGWALISQFKNRTNTAILPFNVHSVATDTKFYGFLGGNNFASAATNHNFAIVVTFAAATAGSQVLCDSISLVPGDIPTRPAPQTADEVLRECQYYYEMSYDNSNAEFASTSGSIYLSQSSFWVSNTATTYASPFSITYNVAKRAAPLINLYSVDGTANNVQSNLVFFNGTTQVSPVNIVVSSRWSPVIGLKSASYTVTNISIAMNSQTTGTNREENSAGIRFQYILDARLGVVV